jgi:putative hemolysin
MKPLLQVLLISILLFFAAFTAASETAIIAASRLKLRRLAASGSKTAKLILKILETPERFFGTILVSNNIVDVLIASVVTALVIALVKNEAKGVFFATAIVSALIIISEVAAKTLAARRSEKLALLLARPVKIMIIIFAPIVRILSMITNAIVGLFGVKKDGKPSLISEEEIRALIKIGEEEDTQHKERYRMLSKVFDFSEALVKDVMIPKEQIVSLDIDASIDAMLDTALEYGYSRLPVYQGSGDNIVGIINMKDLLNLSVNRSLIVLQDIIYRPIFVQHDRKVSELLKEFQKGHTHLAIVVNQAGKVIGLITLEDLLEEIVGEIHDESDLRNHTKKR